MLNILTERFTGLRNFEDLSQDHQTQVENVLWKCFCAAVTVGMSLPWYSEEGTPYDLEGVSYLLPKNHPAKAVGVSFIVDFLALWFVHAREQDAYVEKLLLLISPAKAEAGIYNNCYSYHMPMIFSHLDSVRTERGSFCCVVILVLKRSIHMIWCR